MFSCVGIWDRHAMSGGLTSLNYEGHGKEKSEDNSGCSYPYNNCEVKSNKQGDIRASPARSVVSSATFVKFVNSHQAAVRVQVIILLVLAEAFECGLILS